MLRNTGSTYTLELYGALSTFSQNTFGNYRVPFEVGYFETQLGKVLDARYNTWTSLYSSLGDILYDNTTVLPGPWPMFRGNAKHKYECKITEHT